MKLLIIAIGKEKDFPAYELVAEYSGRISHYMPIEWRYIPASDQNDEEESLLKAVEKESQAYVVALDEIGKEFTSQKFSGFIQLRMNESTKTLIFIIGGSYGLTDAIRDKAQTTLALSKLTFPHQLVRLILAEQIYRACTIMKGEKYHY
jgi:23S rRNA (pseudouridine1915-N3)-methyltransferase